MVVIDNTFLSLMLHPKPRPPKDPSTQQPVERIGDRIEKLLEDLDSESERMILPTPVLSEFLILAGKDASAYLEKIAGMRNILIKPFDEVAAIELAAVEVEDRVKGDKRGGSSGIWTKVRFDRQIVAIARTNRAKRIFSDDEDLAKFATKLGIESCRPGTCHSLLPNRSKWSTKAKREKADLSEGLFPFDPLKNRVIR